MNERNLLLIKFWEWIWSPPPVELDDKVTKVIWLGIPLKIVAYKDKELEVFGFWSHLFHFLDPGYGAFYSYEGSYLSGLKGWIREGEV